MAGALKELHGDHQGSTERRYRMQQEASALHLLQGRGVPALLDSNVDEWRNPATPLFIVMEWIEGRTLSSACSRGPLDLDTSIAITNAILDVLERNSAVGVHHRDLKPDNVMLRAGDQMPALVDFGMAWARPDEAGNDDFQTPVGQELGNRFLRLPEYAPGHEARDFRSDLTMLVGLLFYMLAGAAPRILNDSAGRMPHETHAARFAGLAAGDARWARLRRVFDIGFQVSLDRRFQAPGELRERLSNLQPPAASGTVAELEAALEALELIKTTSQARDVEQTKRAMQSGTEAFRRGVLDGIGVNTFQFGGASATFSRNDTVHTLSFFARPNGSIEPRIEMAHVTMRRAGAIEASSAVAGVRAPRTYYRGPAADVSGFEEAARAEAFEVARDVVREMTDRLGGIYR
jgi:serine/threonine-protein kinase